MQSGQVPFLVNSNPPSEKAQIQLAMQGDSESFECLYRKYSRRVFAICKRMINDESIAEDLVQETFLCAFRRLNTFRGDSLFSTWLHRIAVNAALEQMRRNARHETVDTTSASADEDDDFLLQRAADEPGPEQQALGDEIGRQVEDHLGRMTVIERTAFVLRHAEGHSIEEIAQTMSMNISASKQAIFRAVRKLRGALQPLR
jgi:RNA polymerase sigma-70 factor, ECF subfamily